MQHNTIDANELRVGLARAGKTRVQLAAVLDSPYSTVIGWLTGRYPAPNGFRRRVEVALGMPANSLRPENT